MRRCAVLAAAAVALAAGCGGGSGPTLAEWAAQADEICAEAERRVAEVEPPASLDDVAEYVDATAPAVEEQLRKLRALPRPDDERIDDYLAKVEQTLESSRQLAAAAAAGHAAEAHAAGRRTQQLTRETRMLASELGAERCAAQ